MRIAIEIDTSKDNDAVCESILRVLQNNGEVGFDDLLDCVNGAYEADRRVTRSKDALGRASVHEVLERVDAEEEWDDEMRDKLVLALVKRAVKLGMVQFVTEA